MSHHHDMFVFLQLLRGQPLLGDDEEQEQQHNGKNNDTASPAGVTSKKQKSIAERAK